MSIANEATTEFKGELSIAKMPAHWLMARLGKRVLRPGGLELTRWIVHRLSLEDKDVVELAPGLGATARLIIADRPKSYRGIERDTAAREQASAAVESGHDAKVLSGDATRIPLETATADVVIGEAMLSMQPEKSKAAILEEVRRVLRDGGRYAIHELAVVPDELPEGKLKEIQSDLSGAIHVGVRIGTIREWTTLLEHHGFQVESVQKAPMRLLEPDRLVRDEGPVRAARFIFRALTNPEARRRLLSVRSVFRKHAGHLCGFAMIVRA